MDYPIIISPLSADDGGGFLGRAPDLMGCMADGETPADALKNTELAILEWLDAATARGMVIPAPHSMARRMQAETEALVTAARNAIAGVGQIEARLARLEVAVEEIQAQFEHDQGWVRFVAITGLLPDYSGRSGYIS